MSDFAESEKRQFVRVPLQVAINYRFIRQSGEKPVPGATYKGHTRNLGAGGLLLVAAIPDADMIAELLMQKVIIALELFLPDHEPIGALARVAWLEAINEEQGTCSMGLSFKEITAAAQDDLFRFVINATGL